MAKIREFSERIFTRLLRDFNISEISGAQGRVMFPLWQEDDISFQELKKKTGLSKATLSNRLDRLEEAGHIKRVPVKKDKRTIHIKLTKKNKTLQEKFLQVSNEMGAIYYKGFSEKDMDEFESYLRKLLNNLTEFSQKNK